jgi:hypothetical protein
MTKVRLILMGALAGCVMVAAGCKSLAGSACLKPPPDAEVGNQPPLRIPVGLDPLDTSAALKVPALQDATALPVATRCLEDPPLIQPLPDPVGTEKAQKKNARKASREARDARPPGPRFQGN